MTGQQGQTAKEIHEKEIVRKENGKIWKIISWTGLFFLAVLLRVLWLDKIPFGIHVDEVGMAYDAYWLAREGIDRWSMSYPVYLLNYGSGQSALYAYLCVALVKITGAMNVWIIRLPAVAFGLLTMVSGGAIIRKLWGERAAFLGILLMAVCPYFVMSSRLGLDCDLFLGLSTLSLYLLMEAVEKKKLWLFLAAGLGFGFCLYTYVLSYLILPLFLLAGGIYLLRLRELDWKRIFCFGVPLFLLALPLMLMILINQLGLESLKLGPFTIPRMLLYRGDEFGCYLSPARLRDLFLGLFWHDGEYCSAFPGYGTLFVWSIPLFLVGLFGMVRDCWRRRGKGKFDMRVFLLFFLAAQLIIACTINEIFTYKLNGVFFCLVCCILQAVEMLDTCWKSKRVGTKRWIGNWYRGIGILYLLGGVAFGGFYFSGGGNASYARGWYFREPYEEAWNANIDKIGNRILYTDPNIAYFLYSTRIPPWEITESMLENDSKVFRNLRFYLGAQYRENAAYLVSNDNTEYQQVLVEWGYQKQYEDEHYSVWY
ncbi:MAG: glycosyltransferase family 39 protein [Lachnospiraceae bacterium]|nr:glycosyltransferase family 39 protein [Lachnospiraceae bacterium]